MPDFVPVDHDPFAPQLMPVDYDPFSESSEGVANNLQSYLADAQSSQQQMTHSAGMPAMPTPDYQNPNVPALLRGIAAVPAALYDTFIKPAAAAVTLPSDVYAGRVDPTSSEGIARTLDMAGLLSGNGVADAAAIPEESMALSRKSGYYPPDKSPREFGEDYPSGAPSGGQENLTHTIDGAPIVAPFVAGRRIVGGPDEPLGPAQVVAGTTQATGRGPQAVAPSALPSKSVGSVVINPRSGRPEAVTFSQNLSPADAENVREHEFGHVVDELAGQIPTDGLSKELSAVYNDLNNPQTYGQPYGPKNAGYSGPDVPREYMAEAIRAYLQNPNYLKSAAPKTALMIRHSVNNHPEISRIVQFNAGGLPVFLTPINNDPFKSESPSP